MTHAVLFKKLVHILSVVSFLVAIFFMPQPVSANGLSSNPAAEQYLLSELRSTGIVDLQWDFAEEDRGVSGEFLLNALKDPEVQNKPLVYIASATITSDLWARDLIIPGNLVFAEVEFAGLANFASTQLQSFEIYNSTIGELDLSDSTINRQLRLIGNTFDSNLLVGRSDINGSVDIRDNTINGNVNFYGAHVTGELLFDGTEILSTVAAPGASFPVEFWTTTVDGLASFDNVTFAGDIYFVQSSFKRLSMVDAEFMGTADFSEAIVEQTADFSGSVFSNEVNFDNFYSGSDMTLNDSRFDGYADFSNAVAVRDGNFIGATFNRDVEFEYFSAGRFVDFTGTTFNQLFSFYYVTVTYPYFNNTTFNGPVSFEGIQVGQTLELQDTSYNYTEEPFVLVQASVEGSAIFKGFTSPAGVDLANSRFGGLILTTGDNPQIGFVDLSGTQIDNDLILENITMSSFIAQGLEVGKSTALRHISITENMDLSNANIGFLKLDDQLQWPQNPESFILRGMTYLDIDVGDQGLTEETWERLLRLVNESAYSPQAYAALSQFLADKGHPDWAADVELAQKRRERNEILTPLTGAWLWSWFLDIFAGYGFRPSFAFIWSALVVAIGAFIFRREEDMIPVEQDEVKVDYNPIWYSFALFIPYIELDITSKWEPGPRRKWARNYKYIHVLLGWVLAPIALLAVSGILG